MTTSNLIRGLAACALLTATFALCVPAGAQTAADTAAPIVVLERPSKAVWLKAEVVHADLHTIIVRERDNSMLIHTFTYSEKAQDKMNYIVENGGYQVGDQVSIRWIPGGSEALDIKGRPSKP
jgi:hypothetical protein